MNEVNIFENGILEAFRITQAGGAPLFDRIFLSMVSVDDDIRGRLSNGNADDLLDQSRWVRTKFFEEQWLSIARSDSGKGQKTGILIRAAP